MLSHPGTPLRHLAEGHSQHPLPPFADARNPVQEDTRGQRAVPPNSRTGVVHVAEQRFHRNWLSRLVDWALHGPPGELLPYSVVQALGPQGERYRGVQPIPVDRIVGSVGRHRDFDRRFRPRGQHLETRWNRIQALRQAGHEFQAIQVFQVDGAYFVKDGHHRVSVARAEGQVFIDAEVIEVEVARPLEVARAPVPARRVARVPHGIPQPFRLHRTWNGG